MSGHLVAKGFLWCVLFSCAAVLGCGCSKESEKASKSVKNANTQDLLDSKKSPSVKNCEVNVASEAEYLANTKAFFSVELLAKNGWHINREYPTKLSVRAPEAIRLAKSEFTGQQAKEFGDLRADFAVEFESDAGKHELELELAFAVCTDEHCLPEKKSLTTQLLVK